MGLKIYPAQKNICNSILIPLFYQKNKSVSFVSEQTAKKETRVRRVSHKSLAPLKNIGYNTLFYHQTKTGFCTITYHDHKIVERERDIYIYYIYHLTMVYQDSSQLYSTCFHFLQRFWATTTNHLFTRPGHRTRVDKTRLGTEVVSYPNVGVSWKGVTHKTIGLNTKMA
jgi:hypothetical protein